MYLYGKKILLFIPKFLGYDKIIISELLRKGALVQAYDERPSSNSLIKTFLRINPKIIEPLSRKYFLDIFNKESKTDFDYIFIIKGEAISTKVIKKMKIFFSRSKLIYYSWDSLKNVKYTDEKLELFDRVLSFDRDDCKKYKNMNYLPLFFSPIFNMSKSKINHVYHKDLVFIASLHSDRYKVLKRILFAMEKIDPKFSSFCFLYYPSKIIFFFRKFFDRNFFKVSYDEVNWKALSHKSVVKKIINSNIVVDINHPNQTGLTMRTIESLALKKKLITTNSNIRYEPFYDETNILIIDRNRPFIPIEFVSKPYKEIDNKILNKYSIETWFKTIFSA